MPKIGLDIWCFKYKFVAQQGTILCAYESRDMEFYAHSLDNAPADKWQLLEEHLKGVAELAGRFAAKFNAEKWGYVSGLWHDLGKYSYEFQNKLLSENGIDAHIESKVRVDHSTAGAQHCDDSLKKDEGKVIAYTIAGHHCGLPDGKSVDSCLVKRLEKKAPSIKDCPREILNQKTPVLPFTLQQNRFGFQISFFIRMLYSALVDADFLDTELFSNKEKSSWRKGYPKLNELKLKLLKKLEGFGQHIDESLVNRQRDLVLQQCLKKADSGQGIFSLMVPTGGGKTLSSMAFAFHHALKHNLERIIYVIPYTSIIEQNAEVFRSVFGEDAVLEHHSNFEPKEEDHRSRLAAENWDAPIIVTTNVQFFESLFANRSSKCRKLHNIANSVVILDEVQTLPAEYLLPCIEVLKELALNYKTTIVLCSATQPALQHRENFPQGLEDVMEIMDNPQEVFAALKRTKIELLQPTEDEKLVKIIRQHRQVLCVVNTRRHARKLFELLASKEDSYHLSALMCPAHRSKVLSQAKENLGNGNACRVISTQLIEAGVDIDFPIVYRAMAGIDSIAQTAGRCNREGKITSGKVYIFRPEEKIPAGYLRQTAQTAEGVIRHYKNDILSLEAVKEYFQTYYWSKGELLDEKRILKSIKEGCGNGDFPFKRIAESFKPIDNNMKPVIIPYDEDAEALIDKLNYIESASWISRKLQKYTVQVPPHDWERLVKEGCLEMVRDIFPVLTCPHLYDEDTGLNVNKLDNPDPNDLIG